MGASGAARRVSPLRLAVTFGAGFLLGLAPFLVSILDPVTYLIPLSLRGTLRATTALLGGFIALAARGGEAGGGRGSKMLQAWALLALAGLILLVGFHYRFIAQLPSPSGEMSAEVVVAPPRLESCPCPATASNTECLRDFLTVAPADMDRCWEKSLRLRNQIAWASGYLLLVGGGQSFIWSRLVRAGATPSRLAPGAARDLFLSYSRLDRDLAERLAGDLKARGITVWWDFWEMNVGDSLPRKIEEAISRSAWFGIILSPDAVASPWVRAELDLALTREIEGGLTILPILYRPGELPLSLRGKVWADFTSSYAEGLESLLRRLRAQRT